MAGDDGAELVGHMVGQGEGAIWRPNKPIDLHRGQWWDNVRLSAHRGPDHHVDMETGIRLGAKSSLDVNT